MGSNIKIDKQFECVMSNLLFFFKTYTFLFIFDTWTETEILRCFIGSSEWVFECTSPEIQLRSWCSCQKEFPQDIYKCPYYFGDMEANDETQKYFMETNGDLTQIQHKL